MEFSKGRKRTQIVGFIDMLILLFFIFNTMFWLIYSCPENHNKNGAGRVSTRRTSSASNCNDARNTTNMTFWANTTKVILGNYFDITIPYKMPIVGLQPGTYVLIDFFISSLLLIVVGYLARTDRNEEVEMESAKKTMPCYLALNFATGLGYAAWRAMEHLWAVCVVGIIARTVLWVVVAHFYCGILGGSITTEKNSGDRERKQNVYVVTTPIVTSF